MHAARLRPMACNVNALLATAAAGAMILGMAPAQAGVRDARLQEQYPVDEGSKCGFIDGKGRYIIAAKYDRAGWFEKGLAPVTVGYDTFFIDSSGRIAFSLPDRMRSGGFDKRDDTAIIEAKTGKGFIDLQGNIIVSPVFANLRPFGGELSDDRPYADHSSTIAQISQDRYVVIDRRGKVLFGPRDGPIAILADGVYAVWDAAKQANEYYDRQFKPLAHYREARRSDPPIDKLKFRQVNARHDSGYAKAQRSQEGEDGGWGIIDSSGRWAVPPAYDDIAFNEGEEELTFILAERKGKWGFVNISGQEVIPFRFELLLPFIGNYAPAAMGGKWGLIDRAGNWKLEPRYDEVEPLSDSAVAVLLGDLWGVVNYQGRRLIEPRFRSVNYCRGRDFTLAEEMFEPEDSQRAKDAEEQLRAILEKPPAPDQD